MEASWPLTTTLERATPRNTVHDYYRITGIINPQIEAFTEKQWPVPGYDEIRALATNYDAFSLKLLAGDLPGYSYMMYLRHHGFPSPLLDWTYSLYVAAYFAFRTSSAADRVAIYVFRRHRITASLDRATNQQFTVWVLMHGATDAIFFSNRGTRSAFSLI